MKIPGASIFRVVGLFFSTFSIFILIEAADDDYCYEEPSCGPTTWGGECQTGDRQSPINLQNPQVDFPTTLQLQRYKANHFQIQNNGHHLYVKFKMESGSNEGQPEPDLTFPDPIESGGFMGQPSTREYKFDKAHLHWGPNNTVGSEHLITGISSSMELHLVHYSTSYSSSEEALAKGDDNAIAVLGVLLDAGAMDNGADSSLAPIVKCLDNVREPQTSSECEGALDLTPLLRFQNQFFSYKGSLTTPTCIQKVNWYVLSQPVLISSDLIMAFRSLLNSHNQNMTTNYRPVQERNNRVLLLRGLR